MKNQQKVLEVTSIQKGQSLVLAYYEVDGYSFEKMHPFTMEEFCKIAIDELHEQGCQNYSLNVPEYSSKDAIINRGSYTEEVSYDVLFDCLNVDEMEAIKPAISKRIEQSLTVKN